MLPETVNAALRECLNRINEEYRNLESRVSLHPGMSLNARIDSLAPVVAAQVEASPEFKQLVNASAMLQSGLARGEQFLSVFESDLACFLKLSGAYFKLHPMCHKPDVHERLVTLLNQHLSRPRIVRTRYLVCLPWVSANMSLPVEAGWFRLRTFEAPELEQRINNRARRVFFPNTALDPKTIDRLSRAVWLEVEEDSQSVVRSILPRMARVSVLDLPPPVGRALARLLLLKWHPDREGASESCWLPDFRLGHVIEVSNDLCEWPSTPRPGVMPDLYDEDGHIIEEGPDWLTCENMAALAQYDSKLSALEKCEETRGFLPERVLPYLVKAATSDPWGAGKADQVVNHVLALDALLGDVELGSAARLRARLGTLLGLDGGQLETVRMIYATRSKLVHGDPPEGIDVKLSWAAREFTRRAVVEALEILYHYLLNDERLDRQQFIALLDMLNICRKEPTVLALLKKWPKSHGPDLE